MLNLIFHQHWISMVINHKDTAWNPILLLTLNLLAVFLLISWLYPTTRVWWDFIDFSIFNFFNNSLKTAKGWHTFWAISNWRFSDTPQFIMIFSIAFYWIFKQDKKFTKQRIMELLIFIVLCLSGLTRFTGVSPWWIIKQSFNSLHRSQDVSFNTLWKI